MTTKKTEKKPCKNSFQRNLNSLSLSNTVFSLVVAATVLTFTEMCIDPYIL